MESARERQRGIPNRGRVCAGAGRRGKLLVCEDYRGAARERIYVSFRAGDSVGLSRSALTEISRDLIQDRFLLESPSVSEKLRKGRPSIMLSLNAKYGYFVGVGLTEDPPLMALTDCHGNVLAEHQINMVMAPEEVAAAISRGIPHLTRASNISRNQVLGIGIALSGLVNHAQGICVHSNLLGWHDVPVARIVERATEIPTYIDNDAHAVTLGEKLFGVARELKSFTVIMLGKSIGGGSHMQGQPVSWAYRSRGRDWPLHHGPRRTSLRMRERRLRGRVCLQLSPVKKSRGTRTASGRNR